MFAWKIEKIYTYTRESKWVKAKKQSEIETDKKGWRKSRNTKQMSEEKKEYDEANALSIQWYRDRKREKEQFNK